MICLTELKTLLRNGRSVCLGLPEETYEFGRYLSSNLHYANNSLGMTTSILFSMDDIKNGIHRGYEDASPLPSYFVQNRDRVLKRAPLIVQLLDAKYPDEDYVRMIREGLEHTLKIKIPRRAKIVHDEEEEFYQELFSDQVKTAVEWWTGIIQLQIYHTFGMEDIRAFRGTLAIKIANELKMYGSIELTVSEHPCYQLITAAEAAGVTHAELPYIFPANTQMFVDKSVQIIHNEKNPLTLPKFAPATC